MSDFYDIFLSYHRSDLTAVKIIARVLIQRGLKPFLDKWNLTPGQPWLVEIEETLRTSRSFGIFIGAKGIGPVQVAEMRAALQRKFRQKGYPVIPVLLPGSNPESHQHLPAFLAQQTWVDLRSGLEDQTELERFMNQLQLGTKSEPTVPTIPALQPVTKVDKRKLLRTLILLEAEDLVYLGEITGIRRAEISSDGIKTLAVSLVNRAEILGQLEELQANLVIEYPAIALKGGIS
ncbi:MAG: toll/interleukin-1 receptor domain-containing protein [Dethiobacteria bacterium]